MEQFKVMAAGVCDNIIWDIRTEESIILSHPLYDALRKEINWVKWKQDYLVLYHKWLTLDDESIYNINDLVNRRMIDAVTRLNERNKTSKLYYWFDVDRDRNPQYIWVMCPLSNKVLINLPSSNHPNNRKISPSAPLIFPSND